MYRIRAATPFRKGFRTCGLQHSSQTAGAASNPGLASAIPCQHLKSSFLWCDRAATHRAQHALYLTILLCPCAYTQLLWAKLAFSEIVQFAYPRAQPPTDVANAIDVVCSPSVKDVLQKATSLIYNFTEPWGTPVSCFKAFTPSSTLPVTGAGPTSHMLPRPHGVGRHALAAAIASKSVPSVEDDVHNLGGAVTITQVPWDYLCCTGTYARVVLLCCCVRRCVQRV